MSFEKLEKDELLVIAEEMGVEVAAEATPAEIISEFDALGVTWDLARQSIPALSEKFAEVEQEVKVEDEEKKANEPQVLVKMDRANASYQVRGHTFTQANPFALLAESDAAYVVKNVEGFRRAAPEEAQEFYG